MRTDERSSGRPPGTERGRLQASWARSRRYGVAEDWVHAPYVADRPTDSLLHECGAATIADLSRTVAGEPISMMVTDADGVVLLRLCEDPAMEGALDDVQLAPGFVYSERSVGTNGLGLALADHVPALVRAGDHYCAELRSYTCAAAPVAAPGGGLAGTINLTTPSSSSPALLLALAQAAAGETAALMAARGPARAAPRPPAGPGEELPAAGPDPCVSPGWRGSLLDARHALQAGRTTLVVGEPGAGKAAAAAHAVRAVRPGIRLVRAPLADHEGAAEEWLARWAPVLSRPDTCLVATGLEHLPAAAADGLAAALATVRRPAAAVLTATSLDDLPGPLADRVQAVVEVPALRHRADDITPLARLFARRGQRASEMTPEAAAALRRYAWPGNVAELACVVRHAAARSDRIGLQHLPADVLCSGPAHLTRLERLQRDEIARCLSEDGMTMARAAEVLGMSRATLYRRVTRFGLAVRPHG